MIKMLIVVAACVVSLAAAAATFQGEVSVGTLDSSIGDAEFMTRSNIGMTIFSVCSNGDQCEVRGSIDKNGFLTRVKSVKKLNNGGASEPIVGTKAISNADILKVVKSYKTDARITAALKGKALAAVVVLENRTPGADSIIYDTNEVLFYCDKRRLEAPRKSNGTLAGRITRYETSDGDSDPMVFLSECRYTARK